MIVCIEKSGQSYDYSLACSCLSIMLLCILFIADEILKKQKSTSIAEAVVKAKLTWKGIEPIKMTCVLKSFGYMW